MIELYGFCPDRTDYFTNLLRETDPRVFYGEALLTVMLVQVQILNLEEAA